MASAGRPFFLLRHSAHGHDGSFSGEDNRLMKDLTEKVVLITGGSKGLGLALARALVKERCRIALCARTPEDLELTKVELKSMGGDVLVGACDVSKKEEVDHFVEEVLGRFGKIDIVINDAGIIMVGSMESFTRAEFESAMNVMYWGIVNTTEAVLPSMKRNGFGQIVNVTSIGGVVSIPHLSPYCSAKFAATGYSLGISSELRSQGIYVTTIVPGLMRTGSYVNALFQKGNRKEFKLFSAMSTAPVITISTDKAVREIILAIKKKSIFKILGLPAKVIHQLHHFFPETMVRFYSALEKFIPSRHSKTEFIPGENIRVNSARSELPGFKGVGEVIRRKFQHSP